MIDENEKKDEKNGKLLINLCEYHLLLASEFSSELDSICVPCLLKAALNKEEKEETQKEVEMTLLALKNLGMWKCVLEEWLLSEIKEIIKYHQEHRNLTRLAYYSAWQFLIGRLYNESSLARAIVNEMHFSIEGASELEELAKCVDWKRNFEGKGKRKKIRKK